VRGVLVSRAKEKAQNYTHRLDGRGSAAAAAVAQMRAVAKK